MEKPRFGLSVVNLTPAPLAFWPVSLIVIILCLALLPVGIEQASAKSTCLDYFLVRPGDSLTGIASIYGFDWRVLARYNNLEPPYSLDAGQWLCLPAVVGAQAAASTPHPSQAPRFVARISGRTVQVKLANFPVQEIYTVKATENERTNGYTWQKLGTIRTRQGGKVQAKFNLPAKLRSVPNLLICLKNVRTDELQCLEITNSK